MPTLGITTNSRILRLADLTTLIPYRGAPMTVAAIVDGALKSQQHYATRQLAEDICQGLQSKDYISEALAIYYYVLANTRYMRDPRTIELVRAPYLIVEELRNGRKPALDCDDMTSLIIALLLSGGAQCFAVTVAFKNMVYKGQQQYSHVFAQVHDPQSNTFIVLDPVANINTKQMLQRVVAARVWPIA